MSQRSISQHLFGTFRACRQAAARRFLPAVAVMLLLGATACVQVPELDASISDELQGADYPALVPLDSLLTPLPAPADAARDLERSLAARRDSLKARARRMQQTPVVDDASRDRMAAGVSR